MIAPPKNCINLGTLLQALSCLKGTVTVFVRRSIASRELKGAFRLVSWRVANRRRLCRPVKFRRVTDCMPLVARRSRAALRIKAAGPGFSTSRRCG
jgi:hypothetical protein